MYSCLQLAETVAMRYTEQRFPSLSPPGLKLLIDIESVGKFELPVIACTDCHDLVDLLTGLKGCPQDKSQRLIILSLRERRLLNKTAGLRWQDTRDMVANALTKKVSTSNLDLILKSGILKMNFKTKFYPAPRQVRDYTEETLLRGERHVQET